MSLNQRKNYHMTLSHELDKNFQQYAVVFAQLRLINKAYATFTDAVNNVNMNID